MVVGYSCSEYPTNGVTLVERKTKESVARLMKLVSHRYDVVRFLLFGSRARGDYRLDSDADVAIILRGERGDFVKTMLDLNGIAYDVLLETDINIQVLPVWESEWAQPDEYPNPHLLRNIERDGVSM
jgi:antitoxin ChpS